MVTNTIQPWFLMLNQAPPSQRWTNILLIWHICLMTAHAHRMATWNTPIWPLLTEIWGGTVVGFWLVLGLGDIWHAICPSQNSSSQILDCCWLAKKTSRRGMGRRGGSNRGEPILGWFMLLPIKFQPPKAKPPLPLCFLTCCHFTPLIRELTAVPPNHTGFVFHEAIWCRGAMRWGRRWHAHGVRGQSRQG